MKNENIAIKTMCQVQLYGMQHGEFGPWYESTMEVQQHDRRGFITLNFGDIFATVKAEALRDAIRRCE